MGSFSDVEKYSENFDKYEIPKNLRIIIFYIYIGLRNKDIANKISKDEGRSMSESAIKQKVTKVNKILGTKKRRDIYLFFLNKILSNTSI